MTPKDIDHTAAMMCYIQMSLLGCPGYVIIGDTLAHPPTIPLPAGYQVWYTPMYYNTVWHWRRIFKSLSQITAFSENETKEHESVINSTKIVLKPPTVLADSLKLTESGQLEFNVG